MPPEEAWAAVRVASRAPEGCQRRGRRLQVAAVARRGQRAPRGPARWVVVQARRALAQAREAAWERAAARPTGCSRAAESTAPSAVEGLWAARLQLPWQRRRLVRQCRRRPNGPTDCQRLCLRLTVTTGASWGCLCPANLKIRRPRLGADGAAGGRAGTSGGRRSHGRRLANGPRSWSRQRRLGRRYLRLGIWLPLQHQLLAGQLAAGAREGPRHIRLLARFPMGPAGTTVGVSGCERWFLARALHVSRGGDRLHSGGSL